MAVNGGRMRLLGRPPVGAADRGKGTQPSMADACVRLGIRHRVGCT